MISENRKVCHIAFRILITFTNPFNSNLYSLLQFYFVCYTLLQNCWTLLSVLLLLDESRINVSTLIYIKYNILCMVGRNNNVVNNYWKYNMCETWDSVGATSTLANDNLITFWLGLTELVCCSYMGVLGYLRHIRWRFFEHWNFFAKMNLTPTCTIL